MRGWAVTLLLALGLAVGGGAVAHALWSVSRPLEGTVTSGSFDVTASWVPKRQLDLGGMLPGEDRTGVVEVQHVGDAHWHYHVAHEVAGPLAEHLSAAWYPNGSCDGTPLRLGAVPDSTPPATGDTNGAVLAFGEGTTMCVRYTLSDTAPTTLQGQTSSVQLTVTALQVRP